MSSFEVFFYLILIKGIFVGTAISCNKVVGKHIKQNYWLVLAYFFALGVMLSAILSSNTKATTPQNSKELEVVSQFETPKGFTLFYKGDNNEIVETKFTTYADCAALKNGGKLFLTNYYGECKFGLDAFEKRFEIKIPVSIEKVEK